MEETKHKTLAYKDTVEVRMILGNKVLTDKGEKMGKIKAIHIHPKDLSVEGIVVDMGMFQPSKYIDRGYIGTLNNEGAVLKVTPVTEFEGKLVYDSTGKEIGKVKEVNRGKQTNTLLSIKVKCIDGSKDYIIMADYIATVGEAVMLREPVGDECSDKKEKS